MGKSIFIGYAHNDANRVNTIVDLIKEASRMTVWYDINLRGGDYYFSEIANQIMKSTYFVFIVSDYSVNSDWCLRELEFAVSERKTIIAIWLDHIDIPPRVKLVIQNTHYINYYSASGDGFFRALTTVFRDNAPQQNGENHTDRAIRDSIWDETYFIDSEKLKVIERLLSRERKKEYSICFRPEYAYLLGLAYELGIKVGTDLKRAEFYYRISDYKGNYEGKYLYAAIKLKHENANIAELRSEMIAAAEHQSVFAQTYLGEDYYLGKNGCDTDKEKAYALWQKAAEAGGVFGMYCMAFGYYSGEIGKKDGDLAYMYILMATEYGFPRAYRMLGYMYEDGGYLHKDYEKSIEMYEEAIRRGDYLSLCYEGSIYGRMNDFQKQAELYRQALSLAEAGKIKNGLPYYRMGSIYENGEGVPKDIAKAAEYYLISAENKYHKALLCTVETIMTVSDGRQREYFLNRALALGCKDAAYQLGLIEKSRSGGKTLSDEAVRYFEKGAESGSISCVLELIRNHSRVIGQGNSKEDRLRSIQWFQLFFALADDDFLTEFPDLATYYYAYAIELDYDPDDNMPDREFVQLYLNKSLDVSPKHFYEILQFIVTGYLFPEESNSGLQTDVPHAEKVLRVLENYLSSYYAYIIANHPSDASELWKKTARLFELGYKKISACYSKGSFVQKEKAKSQKYKLKGEQMVPKMIYITKKTDFRH